MKHRLSRPPKQLQLFSTRPRPAKPLPPPREPAAQPPKRSRVPHETRPEVKGPIHVVWRRVKGLPSFRTPRALRRLERAFRVSNEREGFRLIHYSIQENHLHLMVEVKDRRKLSRGLQALGIRLAKGLNSLWRRRKGHVFAERYFAAMLEGWKRIWRTIRYVLNNGRKHGTWAARGKPDPYSSGRWYFPWQSYDFRRPLRRSPVLESRAPEFIPIIGIDSVPGPSWVEFAS